MIELRRGRYFNSAVVIRSVRSSACIARRTFPRESRCLSQEASFPCSS
jgi:hypothetical protein